LIHTQTTLYLFRHGQTDWSASGQHTGRTDLPLNEKGREQAGMLREATGRIKFDAVLVSPLARARETAELAGFATQITLVDDLMEVDYGIYEGQTTKHIRETVPSWTVWTHPLPEGETLEQVAQRCKRVIATATQAGGKVAVVAHGHVLRILTATWLNLPPSEGKHFMLDTSTISILSHEHETPAVRIWNTPIDLLARL
jgi:probable phosphoglycerate mutase